MERLCSWIQVCTYLINLLFITICDENGAIVFSVCNIIFLLVTGIISLGGLFLISIQPRRSSFEMQLSIFLVVGSSLGTVAMGYVSFVRDRNDIQGFVNLMNDLISDAVTDIEKLRVKLQKLQTQTIT
jgi:hypothetical protein